MTKYLVLYRADQSATEAMAAATPEQQQASMEAWMTWAGKAGPAIVDLGSPLAAAAGTTVSGDAVGGFSILEADSAEALQGVLEGHPHSAQGGTIEVYEFLPIPGM
jgi:YCII-related domain-containing protein